MQNNSWLSSIVGRQMRKLISSVIFACLLCTVWGCGTKVGTQKIGYESAYRQINQNALTGKGISVYSQKVLSRYNLEDEYESAPRHVINIMTETARSDNRRDLLFALAELSYDAAGKTIRDAEPGFFEESRQYFLNAAIFSYFYLFEPHMDESADFYERNFRWACDLYNFALARAFTNKSGHLEFTGGERKLPNKSITIEIDKDTYPWDVASNNSVVLAADEFKIYGLSHRNRESGVGVPFIVVQEKNETHSMKRSYIGSMFLKLEGGLTTFLKVGTKGVVTLYNPMDTSTVAVSGSKVPLELDLSISLAQTLNQGLLWNVGLKEFFTGKNRFETGLYLISPYQPGKIPVVFVHGTFSNPVAWAEMCNSLMADPLVRRSFHFWFYLYDSNRPITLSALSLRGALREKLEALDPQEKDPLLKKMVVVGHSQGGVLTKLTATQTKDRIVREVTGKGLDELDLDAEQRMLLERTAVFEPLPFVDRVVFIATPHRGSRLVSGWVRNLVQKVVTLPAETLNISSNVAEAIPAENIPEQWNYGKTPTSIDSMDPQNPALLALSEIPVAKGVKSHSIIAVQGDGDPTAGSDGVVAYQSAHLDYVDSEYVVQPGGHSIQWHPLAIEEVRRILHLHLKESSQSP